jgi:hypothetical protein
VITIMSYEEGEAKNKNAMAMKGRGWLQST